MNDPLLERSPAGGGLLFSEIFQIWISQVILSIFLFENPILFALFRRPSFFIQTFFIQTFFIQTFFIETFFEPTFFVSISWKSDQIWSLDQIRFWSSFNWIAPFTGNRFNPVLSEKIALSFEPITCILPLRRDSRFDWNKKNTIFLFDHLIRTPCWVFEWRGSASWNRGLDLWARKPR